ncbi:MAG: hypothetical protein P4L67_04590 [Candidatus Pacebacteria bacterium]|nr:hypothetical protein [Candidatus Paceibacterota bacterium]
MTWNDVNHRTCCGLCGYSVSKQSTKEAAIAVWNQRPHYPQTAAILEGIAAAIKSGRSTSMFGQSVCVVAVSDREAFLREQGFL